MLPEWNGLWIWFVFTGSVVIFRKKNPDLLFVISFWASLVFSIGIEGPVPRYYTALVPVALWIGLGGVEATGRFLLSMDNGDSSAS